MHRCKSASTVMLSVLIGTIIKCIELALHTHFRSGCSMKPVSGSGSSYNNLSASAWEEHELLHGVADQSLHRTEQTTSGTGVRLAEMSYLFVQDVVHPLNSGFRKASYVRHNKLFIMLTSFGHLACRRGWVESHTLQFCVKLAYHHVALRRVFADVFF